MIQNIRIIPLDLERMYGQMYLIRCFENTLEDLFKKGVLFGTIHSCVGQEAIGVGIVNALSKGDSITGSHRSHGHILAHTNNIKDVMAEVMGKACGVVGGRGGSQHLQKDDFYSNGVQGSMVPVAVGMALAEKIKNTGRIVLCFMGDGTLGQGVIYESMNLASLWDLPVMFVVENNFYAMSTKVEDAVAGSIVERGKVFGIESSEITSNDVEVIYNHAVAIVDKIRKNSKPYFWVINTYRLSGHSKSDDRCYRSKEEEGEWSKRDPLLITGSKIAVDVRENIERECQQKIKEALEEMKAACFPSKEFLHDNIYRGFRR